VRRGGRVATTTRVPDDATLAAGGLTGGSVLAQPERDVLASLVERAAAGTLRIDVDAVLPLEQARDALATIAAGNARGKTVIVIHD
jgi:NADPH:quinone reductase-like Zn-dependent oxidoreductase